MLLNLLETSRNLLIKIPEIINGIANPNEYAHKRVIPERRLVSVLAKTKIDPKIGQIQGVHPNPKAAPRRKGKAKFWLYRFVIILKSLFINLKLIIPINCNEKNIIIMPAIILRVRELFKKNFPR